MLRFIRQLANPATFKPSKTASDSLPKIGSTGDRHRSRPIYILNVDYFSKILAIRALITVVDRITAVLTTVSPAPLHRFSSQQNLHVFTQAPKKHCLLHLLSLHCVSTPASVSAQPLLEYSNPNAMPHSFCVNSKEKSANL